LVAWIAQGAEFPTRNAHVMAAVTSATRNHLLDAGLNPDEDRGRLHVDNFIMRPYQLRRFPLAIGSEDDCE